jgi:hypothetical protein
MGFGRHFSLDSMGPGLGPGLPLELLPPPVPVYWTGVGGLLVPVLRLPLFFNFFNKLAVQFLKKCFYP